MRALFVAWLALSLFIAQSVGVWAQSAPAYNGRVNNAIAGIVSQKAAQEGFAANDNRIGATENAIGAGIGGFATTVVGGAVAGIVTGTAIAWLPLLAIAAAVGVTAVVITAGYQWVFSGNTSADGTVVTQVTPQGSSVPSTTALVQGQTAWKVTDGSVACWGGTPDLATTCYK